MTEQLLKIRGLKIEGKSDEVWSPIVNGIDLDLKKGEVLGLIGESGAGKSTVGLAAMGFTRDGCRISGGTVDFDGVDLVAASAAVKRNMLGKRIAYVAQSAAASFNPAHRLIDQHTEAPTQHKIRAKAESELMVWSFTAVCACQIPITLAFAIRTRSLAGNCSAR